MSGEAVGAIATIIVALLTVLGAPLVQRWLNRRHAEREAQARAELAEAEVDRKRAEVALFPTSGMQQLVKEWQEFSRALQEQVDALKAERAEDRQLIERLRTQVKTLEGEREHDNEEKEQARKRMVVLEKTLQEQSGLISKMTVSQERAERQIAALRRGITLLIGQVTEAGLSPVWHPEDDDSERSDKT